MNKLFIFFFVAFNTLYLNFVSYALESRIDTQEVLCGNNIRYNDSGILDWHSHSSTYCEIKVKSFPRFLILYDRGNNNPSKSSNGSSNDFFSIVKTIKVYSLSPRRSTLKNFTDSNGRFLNYQVSRNSRFYDKNSIKLPINPIKNFEKSKFSDFLKSDSNSEIEKHITSSNEDIYFSKNFNSAVFSQYGKKYFEFLEHSSDDNNKIFVLRLISHDGSRSDRPVRVQDEKLDIVYQYKHDFEIPIVDVWSDEDPKINLLLSNVIIEIVTFKLGELEPDDIRTVRIIRN